MIQLSMCFSKLNNSIPISSGWFISPSKTSTAEYQSLYFDEPSVKSSYHAGQKSEWMVNGIDRSAFYVDGDPVRKPSKKIIELASEKLIELTKSGELFPKPLERIIYMNAWGKGASAAFNEESINTNPYAPSTPQFDAWLDGWSGK